MALVDDLTWRLHCRHCLRSRKHPRRILALTSRLAGSVLHMPFWLSLIVQHRRYQSRSQLTVSVCTYSVSQSHLLAIQTCLFSGFAYVLLTTSILGCIVVGIHETIFSISCRHMLEPFWKILVVLTGWQEGAVAFSRPSKNWLGVSAVRFSGSSLTAVSGLAVRIWQVTLLFWIKRWWSFGCPLLQSWLSCNLEPVFPRFHQSMGSGWIEFPKNLFIG